MCVGRRRGLVRGEIRVWIGVYYKDFFSFCVGFGVESSVSFGRVLSRVVICLDLCFVKFFWL